MTHLVAPDEGATSELYWARAEDDHAVTWQGSIMFLDDGSATFKCWSDEDEPFVLHIMGNRIVVANTEDQPPDEDTYVFDTARFARMPVGAIEAILNYNWEDEAADWETEGQPEHHIFNDMKIVEEWLDLHVRPASSPSSTGRREA